MGNESASLQPERRDYEGPERRKCAKDAPCSNVLHLLVETEGQRRQSAAEYKALTGTVEGLRGLVSALPREISAQITKDREEVEKALDREREQIAGDLATERKERETQIKTERKELDGTLEKGSENFAEIFRRLTKLERSVLALIIFFGLVECGKGVAYIWTWVAH